MKIICFFALFIVGINAFPNFGVPRVVGINGFPNFKIRPIDFKDERLISDSIASAIQDASQAIADAGLDPLYVEGGSISYALPVEVLFAVDAVLEELASDGLSNIVINDINYSLITSRLTFDISLPLIRASLNKAAADITFFGKQYSFSASGNVAISTIRITGNIRVSVGVITGISIRSIDMGFSLGGIESALNVVVQDYDLSDYINTFVGTTILATLDEFSAEINELLEIIITNIVEGS